MAMVNWRARQIRAKHGSQTPGKTKGPSCQTNPVKKYFATHPHAFRDPQYQMWHNQFKKENMGGAKA